ncbi:branched-chain amino acid ABC transporter ATP-binding protein [Neobacillus bataviensis LMG 21833]|uniref:Branched-chain amino acid ABC transporter ATP-binding protein n=1 Tax=Neobacillus bataviensis LMG 21833 TaxID=1117379 RepID=K6DM86_9BACI|nr:ABC transporter ATP-binding protein [Neobacillus bataviensis]EKN69424.1 branched-chain amino acid ABC transporter ATP-binding protein [Neobacillus bataviensis LMG 21833]
MKKENILSLKGLSKHFGGIKVIEDVTLEVTVGERVGLIGPNGAGKSTLFHMIAGDLEPSGGTIGYFNEMINRLPNYKRTENGIVRTFQKNNLMSGLTVKENLMLVLQRINKKHTQWWKKANQKNYPLLFEELEALLQEWNLQEYSHTKVQDLSYGVQRQIEIILAIAGKPKLLLLDEPTAGMSQVETDQIITLINRLPLEVTIMMIEHDIEVLFGNMDRVIVLNAGTLIADGSPEAVRENPEVREIYMGKEELANA